MGQALQPDNIPQLLRASNTTCTLAAVHGGKTTRITIGGQQYPLTGTLTLNTATSGFGGIDTGSVSSGLLQFWNVYAVHNGGTVGLIASLAGPSTGPAGFTSAYKLVGAFCNVGDDSSIGSTCTIEGTIETEWINVINPANYVSNVSSAGTNAFHKLAWKRIGDTMYMDWYFRMGTTGVASGGAVGLSPAGGVVLDAVKNAAGSNRAGSKGSAAWFDLSANQEIFLVPYFAGTNNIRFVKSLTGADLASTADIPTNSDDQVSCNINFPVSGWAKTVLG